ncbi:VanZ family protein [Streptococcus cameli]
MTDWLETNGELGKKGKLVMNALVRLYLVAIGLMCFLPQWVFPNPKETPTPGIIQIGRFYLLPTPFNTLVNGDKIDSFSDLFWVVLQNVSNVFLLYPLVLGLLFLKPSWRNWKIVLRNSFFMSLFIECTQLLLDGLFDAQRVFEIDDLWTNSLGGLLAFWTYLLLQKYLKGKPA